jgi:hypothetical protein
LTPSARSGNLIAGDGTKNGLPAPNKELQQTQNNRLTEKAPYKSRANLPHTASGLRHSLDFTLRLGLIPHSPNEAAILSAFAAVLR